MEILYLGHSSFQIKAKNASVVTDPFDPQYVGIRFPKVSATIVTLSHEHKDHNASELVSDVKKVISGPGEYEIEELSVIGIPSYHDDKKGSERGRNTIYVFEADGLRLAHLGDLGHIPSEEKIETIGDLDVLMLPVGGVYTIGPKEAADVVRLLEPKIVIPMHYQIEGLNRAVFADLQDEKAFISELGYQTRNEKKISLKGGLAPEGPPEIVLLSLN